MVLSPFVHPLDHHPVWMFSLLRSENLIAVVRAVYKGINPSTADSLLFLVAASVRTFFKRKTPIS
jgi:hypothetical protein